MMKNFLRKRKLIKECFEIRDKTKYFFVKPRKLIEINKLPKDVAINEISLQNLPRNSFCFFEDFESKISIAIITIGKKLYIKPAFYYETLEERFNELGLKKRPISIPFFKGAVPYDLEWIRHYCEEYRKGEEQHQLFWEMIGLGD